MILGSQSGEVFFVQGSLQAFSSETVVRSQCVQPMAGTVMGAQDGASKVLATPDKHVRVYIFMETLKPSDPETLRPSNRNLLGDQFEGRPTDQAKLNLETPLHVADARSGRLGPATPPSCALLGVERISARLLFQLPRCAVCARPTEKRVCRFPQISTEALDSKNGTVDSLEASGVGIWFATRVGEHLPSALLLGKSDS